MDFTTQLFSENTLNAIGWTVLHSFWQAFVVALILSAYLLGLKNQNAQKRYFASFLALGITMVLAVFTFCWLLSKVEMAPVVTSGIFTGSEVPDHYFIKYAPSALTDYFNRHLPLIVTVWMLGLGVFVLKMMGGLLYIQRLKHHRNWPLAEHWQRQLKNLGDRLGLEKAVRLAESALVHTPVVAGWLKPVILLPIGAINNLSTEQVEAILSHELAHIYRHDYLLNLLQSVIEFLLYFNPAVWWISSNIRNERENCCDDLAVSLCGDSMAYAKGLVSLQEMRWATPGFAMPFLRSKGQLLNRIKRILESSPSKSNAMEKLSATFLLLAAVLMLSMQAGTRSGNTENQFAIGETPWAMPEGQAAFAEFVTLPQVAADTLPKAKNKTMFHRQNDDGDVEIVVENHKITSLKINGEEIPKERYGEYTDLAEELLHEVETIPGTPLPPEPPLPPAPPAFEEPPTAPMPPAPPTAPTAPQIYTEKKTSKIITRQDGKNTTLLIESERGAEPVEIKIKNGKKRKITVNGKKLKRRKRGKTEEIIIEQEVEDNLPGYIFLDGDGVYHVDGGYSNHNPRLLFSPEENELVTSRLEFAVPNTEGVYKFHWGKDFHFNGNEDTDKVLDELRQKLEEQGSTREELDRYIENLSKYMVESQSKKLGKLHTEMEIEKDAMREYNEQQYDVYRDQISELIEQQREMQNQQRELIRHRRAAIEEYKRELEKVKKQKSTRRISSSKAQ